MTAPIHVDSTQVHGRWQIDFPHLNERAMEAITYVLEDLLNLDTKEVGNEIQMLNPHRTDAEFGSFSISTETGRWADFACDDSESKGGDVVSLVAYIKQIGQFEAAKLLQTRLDGLAGPKARSTGLAMSAQNSTAAFRNSDFVVPVTKMRPSAQCTYPDGIEEPAATASPAVKAKPVCSPAKEQEPIPATPQRAGHVTTPYEYRDMSGKPIAVACRIDHGEGKTFLIYTLRRNHKDQLYWEATAPDKPRPLYGLDKLHARQDAPVVFCEGEKTADAAATLLPNFVATTTMNGAKSPGHSDFSPLAGRRVLIAPDNDAAGEAYKAKVITLVQQAGGEVTGVLRYPSEVFGQVVEGVHADVPEKYDLADALEEGWTAERMAAAIKQIGVLTEVVNASIDMADAQTLPVGFVVNEAGVHVEKRNKDGRPHIAWLCSPIEVVALSRSGRSQSWGYLVRFVDLDGVTHDWCIPAGMFGAEQSAIWSNLLSLGLRLSPNPSDRLDLARFLQNCKPATRALAVSQPGWCGKQFVLSDGTCFGKSDDIVTFETRDPLNRDTFSPSGELEAWKTDVAELCSGNSRLILAVCGALAACALEPLAEENFGFHFRGPSSIGKTTALLVAASVWGKPERVIKRWRATANGLEGIAAQHNDLLLPLDEIAEISPQDAAKAAYMLANGQGRVRANVHGNARPTTRWRTLLISTGEVGLADHLAEAGIIVRAGQEARLMDIEADAGAGYGLFDTTHHVLDGAAMSMLLKRRCDASNGHAGRTFVEHLANAATREMALTRIKQLIEHFEATALPEQSAGQVQRVAHHMALVAAVGEYAIEIGLLPWEVGHASWAAKTCFDGWLIHRGGAGQLEATQAVEQVRQFLQTRGDSNFRWLSQDRNAEPETRSMGPVYGYKRASDDGRTEFLIFPASYKDEVCRGLDAKTVTRHLAAQGLLKRSTDGKNQLSIRIPGKGNTRVYVVSADLLGTADTPAPQAAEQPELEDSDLTVRYTV